MSVVDGGWGAIFAEEALAQAIEHEVDDRRGVEREDLADDEAAENGEAEGAAELGADAGAKGEWDGSEEGGGSGHQDGAEAEDAGLEDGVLGAHVLLAFELQGEVDHDDGVLLDDADEQNDADERDDVEVGVEEDEGDDSAERGGGQRGEDGDGVNEAFVEDTETM